MSQPAAVLSASLTRSSPRCQACSSLPRLPSGSSRLCSGPATKPSSEIDIWHVVSCTNTLPTGGDLQADRQPHTSQTARLFFAPSVPHRAEKQHYRAKERRHHNPRVGGSSPSSAGRSSQRFRPQRRPPPASVPDALAEASAPVEPLPS